MTRFDADTPHAREALVVDAIAAHRERDSAFCTLEADEDPSGDPAFEPPWVQYADDELNLDCTDEELDALADVLDRFPAFTAVEHASFEDAPGTNVRVEARPGDERVAEFVDAVFRDAYGLPEDFTLWAAQV